LSRKTSRKDRELTEIKKWKYGRKTERARTSGRLLNIGRENKKEDKGNERI